MTKYLVTENACAKNKQMAIDAGCDMQQTDRVYPCYGWGFAVDNTQHLTQEQIDSLVEFEDLTLEQQQDIEPTEGS